VSIREGRFEEPIGGAFARINPSISFDRRLYREDIAGSIAYAKALGRLGVVSAREESAIVEGLRAIEREIAEGTFPFREEDEDIHMNIERRLSEKIGEAAGKLHTGRSRNEQIVLDERLYLFGAVDSLRGGLRALCRALVNKAGEHLGVVFPSYTHLRQAQLISLAHLYLAYVHALLRDGERLDDFEKRLKVLPLGSGAVAGSSIGIDRKLLMRELGFSSLSRNSIDAVSTRDFIAEFEFVCASIMVTLSRVSEDLIIYSSEEFGFLVLPDSSATTSSLMPQKKNPDSLELVRGKSARVIGHLFALFTLMKGLPYAYDRDLQEDKEGLFDAADTVLACVDVTAEAIGGIEVNRERVAAALAAAGGLLYATDLADYLVRKGLPFREAHLTVGRIAREAAGKNRPLEGFALEDLRSFSPLFGEDVCGIFDPVRSLNGHDVPGGTAIGRIEEEIKRIRKELGWKEAQR
jgi:argininosuccinate lyase